MGTLETLVEDDARTRAELLALRAELGLQVFAPLIVEECADLVGFKPGPVSISKLCR